MKHQPNHPLGRRILFLAAALFLTLGLGFGYILSAMGNMEPAEVETLRGQLGIVLGVTLVAGAFFTWRIVESANRYLANGLQEPAAARVTEGANSEEGQGAEAQAVAPEVQVEKSEAQKAIDATVRGISIESARLASSLAEVEKILSTVHRPSTPQVSKGLRLTDNPNWPDTKSA